MSQQALLTPPGQVTMESGLDEDVQANLCCPSPLSCCLSTICFPCWLTSCKVIPQNEHAAVLVWGKYVGSITKPGLRLVNPIGTEFRNASTARQTIQMNDLKIVDAKGNPIIVSGNIAYQMYSVKKAKVDVVNSDTYLFQQAPMALRKVASKFTYDTLRSDVSGEVERMLRSTLQQSVVDAGIQVLKFDLTDLSYAPEIAQSMLVKQQAEAMVEARRLVTASAVSIACDAAKQVRTSGYDMSKECEEQLIKNVLTVICSHSGVTPTLGV